jgi:glycerol-3-phosphate cytidylyltransferase
MILTLEKAKKEGKTVGFTASTFDLLHPGHIAMLAEAKSMCDILVVGLLSDPTISRPHLKNKPVQTLFERFIQIQAVKYIDYLIPFESEEDLEQMILTIMPDIRFVGEEYKDQDHTGKNIVGVKIHYNKRKHKYSSTELRNRLK